MKVEKIYFSDIQPSDYNPRKISQNEMSSLSHNLKEFGLVDPIIINLKNNHIIGGHQRYKVLARKYGGNEKSQLHLIKLGDIGWVFEEDKLTIKDEEHEKALNLALNRIKGEWDFSKLSPILYDLRNSDFNTNLTGFSTFEIDKFTIPSDLNLEFNEIAEIEKGERKPETNNDTPEEQQDTSTTNNETDDELENDDVLVSAEEIERLHKHKCPNCGYEW